MLSNLLNPNLSFWHSFPCGNVGHQKSSSILAQRVVQKYFPKSFLILQGLQRAEEDVTLKPSKHSPIVWNSSGKSQAGESPQKRGRLLSAAERAGEELAAFQGLQGLDIDPDAPVALKASPSNSGSEAGGMSICW